MNLGLNFGPTSTTSYVTLYTLFNLSKAYNSTDMNLNKLWETVKDKKAWRVAVHGATKSQMQLSNWTPPPTKAYFPYSKSRNIDTCLAVRIS